MLRRVMFCLTVGGVVSTLAILSACPLQAQSLEASSGTDPCDPDGFPLLLMMPNENQSLVVTDLPESGLRLIASRTPEFKSLWATSVPQGSTTALSPLQPFSVFLKNEGSRTIIGYTVSWASTDASGSTNTDYRTVLDAINLKGLVEPHTSRLATILMQDVASSPFIDGTMTPEIIDESKRLASQASISITLEAVMYEDGTTLGRDPSRSIEQMKARLRSEYDLFQRLAGLKASEEAVTASLQLVADSLKPDSKLMFRNDPYKEWYRYYLASKARSLLQFAKVRGVNELLSQVQVTLATKKYPTLLINTKED